MNWHLAVLKKYAVFSVRARRKEYWIFVLINILVVYILAMIDNLLGTLNTQAGVGVLSGIYSLAVFLPCLGVSVRRLHDTNRTGWWVLISVIPFIGFLMLLFFMLQNSTPENNTYGTHPKNIAL